MNKFRVGDRVQLVGDIDVYRNLHYNVIYEISKLDNYGGYDYFYLKGEILYSYNSEGFVKISNKGKLLISHRSKA